MDVRGQTVMMHTLETSTEFYHQAGSFPRRQRNGKSSRLRLKTTDISYVIKQLKQRSHGKAKFAKEVTY